MPSAQQGSLGQARRLGARSCPAQLAMYSKFRNRVMFPIANDSRARDRVHRAHALHRREGWAEVPQLARDRHLLEVARAVQSRPCQGSHPQTRLRDPGRGADGLHLGLRRRISQRDRQFRHRVHRTPGQAARPLQQERGRELRSRYRRRQGHRAHARPLGRGRIPGQGPDA